MTNNIFGRYAPFVQASIHAVAKTIKSVKIHITAYI